MKSFASDNNAGVCPEVMAALAEINRGHCKAYGGDAYTASAERKFKETFGQSAAAHFVFNGTAANVLSIKAYCRPYHAVICAETAHIYNDECGAPEALTGCKLITVKTTDGKLTPDLIKSNLGGRGDQHHVQPRLVSITQSTEVGTVYTVSEVRALARYCRTENLILHMDGARLANAAANLGCALKEITTDAGVDVLSFGATKNGAMGAEAVVFLQSSPAEVTAGEDFKYLRKQQMQLPSKMRFLAAQFEALLTGELWRRNALHANEMARELAAGLKEIDQVQITQPVQANGIFARLSPGAVKRLQERYFFYVLNEDLGDVRWMTSFDTSAEDVHGFIHAVATAINFDNK